MLSFQPPPGLGAPSPILGQDTSEIAGSSGKTDDRDGHRQSSRVSQRAGSVIYPNAPASRSPYRAECDESRAGSGVGSRDELIVEKNRNCTGREEGTLIDGDPLWYPRVSRAERRRVRWIKHGWLGPGSRWADALCWNVSACSARSIKSSSCQHVRTLSQGTCEYSPKKRGVGLAAPSTKFHLTRRCPFPQSLQGRGCGQPRRRPERQTGASVAVAAPSVHGVGVGGEGPKPRHGLGLARPRH